MTFYSNWFRGNWSLPWVAHRYLRTFGSGLTAYKAFNVAHAFGEMQLGRSVVRSLPFVLRLEPTSTCNLRCPRCSTGLGIDPRPKGFMSLEDLDFLIDQIKDHMVFVRLDGDGEPLLHPRIDEMVARFKAAGIAVTMSSHLNTPPKAGWKALVESGVDRIVVAMDGTTQDIYERYRRKGKLDRVLTHLAELVAAKKACGSSTPEIDLQFLDWEYNAHQIPEARQIAKEYGCDRLTVIRPDWMIKHGKADPENPRRCFWLWTVLTVDWQLNYHSCTNAWTLPFPRLNARRTPPAQMWNSEPIIEARRFNTGKRSPTISEDKGNLCHRCTDMLVAPRPEGYVCE